MGKKYGDSWETIDEAGKGGQAEVFRVRDLAGDGDEFVLKRLTNPKRVGRFKQEAKTIMQLKHKRIVQLVDHQLEADPYYIVFERCAGGSLDKAHPYWRGDFGATVALFSEILEGVAFAHSQEVLHRDLKPDNIFLRRPDGDVAIGDFGLCFLIGTEDENRLTEPWEAVGARYYMAPELEDGRKLDVTAAADVYSLGKILYWLLTGRIFSREKHRDEEYDLKEKNDNWPTGWRAPHMEHVNILLDDMLVEDASKRAQLDSIVKRMPLLQHLVTGHYHVMNKSVPQLCMFCGNGRYVPGTGLARATDTLRRACNACGHLVSFRVDLGKMDHRWRAD